MDKKKKNILIIGKGAAAAALGKKLRQNETVDNIFMAPSSEVDIREDDLTGLLKFALENEIDLTIPVSEKALDADIVSFFQTNGQNIFI